MMRILVGRSAASAWLVLGSALLVLVTMLPGCATSNKKMDDPNQTYTASDIPAYRQRATNRLQLATLYYQDGKGVFALDEIKQAILVDPGLDQLYWMRGLIQMQLGDNPAAEVSFKTALTINPHSPDLKHNYGVLLCKTNRADEGLRLFDAVLQDPSYGQRAKTYLEQGICLSTVNRKDEAQASFLQSYKLDASNPTTAYMLSSLMFERHEDVRAQFYIRRVNNSEQASAESLWLGIKIERRIGNQDAVSQLAAQLNKRFGTSHQAASYERGAFDE